MPTITNRKETLTLLSGGAVALFLFVPVFFSIPGWARIVMLVIVAYVVYLTLRLAWIMADPVDESVSLKPCATAAQSRGLCWLCGKNRAAHRTLRVGYRKPTARALHFEFVDTLLLGEGMADDIQMSVPICDSCAKRYMFLSRFRAFAPAGLDRSFKVLRRKPGYLRGLRYPFEPSNIRIAD